MKIKEIFNFLEQLPRAVRLYKQAYNAVSSGVDAKTVVNTFSTFDQKIDHFLKTLKQEKTQASALFGKNSLFMYTEGGNDHFAETWKDFFELVNIAGEKTEIEIAQMNDPDENASLGRIRYQAQLFEQYYKSLDPRLSPALEDSQKTFETQIKLMSLAPKGKHEITLPNGKKVTMTLSRRKSDQNTPKAP